MSNTLREKDDGYRGYLYNPVTGRTFRCTNALKSCRADLVRVAGPDITEATVTASRAVNPGQDDADARQSADAAVQEASEPETAPNTAEADAAMVALLDEAAECEDKERLKAIGAQIGLKLTANMNEETMRDRIRGRIEVIRAASISVE